MARRICALWIWGGYPESGRAIHRPEDLVGGSCATVENLGRNLNSSRTAILRQLSGIRSSSATKLIDSRNRLPKRVRNATELLIQHQTAIITSLTKEIEAGKRGSRREARLVLPKIHFKFLVALICTVAISILAQTTFAQGPTSQDVDRASLLQNQT